MSADSKVNFVVVVRIVGVVALDFEFVGSATLVVTL